MNTLERRLLKIESAARQREGNLSLLTGAELYERIDTLLARMGTNRERVISEHGSLNRFRAYLAGATS